MENVFDVNLPIDLQATDADAVTLLLTAVEGRIPLNGAAATLTGAILPVAGNIYITSVGDDSGITFAIVGSLAGAPVTETLSGANAGTATSVNDYDFVISITSSAATSGDVSAGFTSGQDQLAIAQTLAGADAIDLNGDYKSGTINNIGSPCYLSITPSGDESSNTFTVAGNDVNGAAITQAVNGTNATLITISEAFQNISSVSCSQDCVDDIEIGILNQTHSQWVPIDGNRRFLAASGFANFDEGTTGNVTMEYGTFNPLYDYKNGTLLGKIADTVLVSKTANAGTPLNNPADAVRLRVDSLNGRVWFSTRQADSANAKP